MSRLKEHLEPVAATSGRKHTCNFNFSSAPPLTARGGPRAGHRIGPIKPHVEGTVTAALLRTCSRGF